jgi:hypothetical protein
MEVHLWLGLLLVDGNSVYSYFLICIGDERKAFGQSHPARYNFQTFRLQILNLEERMCKLHVVYNYSIQYILKIRVFWDVTLCRQGQRYRRFRMTGCVHCRGISSLSFLNYTKVENGRSKFLQQFVTIYPSTRSVTSEELNIHKHRPKEIISHVLFICKLEVVFINKSLWFVAYFIVYF